jgi:hypothetical protein
MHETDNGISGTFTQDGKEYDGAQFFKMVATAHAALFCPNGHKFVQVGAENDNRVACYARGCSIYGIVYSVQWPMLHLEAVQD